MRVFGCMCVCVSVCLCGGTRWEAEQEHARARRARQVVRSHVRGSLLEAGERYSGRQWQEAEARADQSQRGNGFVCCQAVGRKSKSEFRQVQGTIEGRRQAGQAGQAGAGHRAGRQEQTGEAARDNVKKWAQNSGCRDADHRSSSGRAG